MIISDFYLEVNCDSIDKLDKILQKRYKNCSNEFSLETEEGFPKLCILVNGIYACVHYFRDEEDCGLYAYTDDKITLNNIVFHIGNENDETEISENMIISNDLAIELARCFFKNQSMSEKVKWFEL